MRCQRGVFLWVAALAFCAGAPVAIGAPPEPEVVLDDVVNREAIGPWFRVAVTGRADVVQLGDSNQLFASSGWDHGWIRALDNRFGLYATGLMALGEGAGNGTGSGYFYNVAGPASFGQFAYAGAPLSLDVFMSPNVMMWPFRYLYVPEGSFAGRNDAHGLFIDRLSGLDVNGPLRFTVLCGAFVTMSPGQFQLQVRQGQAPFQTLAAGPVTTTDSREFELFTATLDLPAATRESTLNLRLSPVGGDVTGPFIAYYARAENRSRDFGVALHTLYADGGRTARDMAGALYAADDAYLSLFFSRVRGLQGATKSVLVRVNAGVNDRGENEPSILLGVVPGNSAEAYVDNVRGIRQRILDIWALNGWDQQEVHFLVAVTHPIAGPDDALLEEYRHAAAEWVVQTPRCALTNFNALTSWTELRTNRWYAQQGFDVNHLAQMGYQVLAERELRSLEGSACWVDLNQDAAIDIEDLYAWHVDRPDLDGNGSSDYADGKCLGNAIRLDERTDIGTPSTPEPPMP